MWAAWVSESIHMSSLIPLRDWAKNLKMVNLYIIGYMLGRRKFTANAPKFMELNWMKLMKMSISGKSSQRQGKTKNVLKIESQKELVQLWKYSIWLNWYHLEIILYKYLPPWNSVDKQYTILRWSMVQLDKIWHT